MFIGVLCTAGCISSRWPAACLARSMLPNCSIQIFTIVFVYKLTTSPQNNSLGGYTKDHEVELDYSMSTLHVRYNVKEDSHVLRKCKCHPRHHNGIDKRIYRGSRYCHLCCLYKPSRSFNCDFNIICSCLILSSWASTTSISSLSRCTRFSIQAIASAALLPAPSPTELM